MRNIRLIIEYDGSAYCGWQIQDNGATIQGVLQDALFELTGQPHICIGCSRTDAGVHAHGFAVNFHTESTIPVERFPMALNAFLPQDICVLSCDEVSESFHARFDAVSKTYRYLWYYGAVPSSLISRYAWHIRTPKYDSPEGASLLCNDVKRADEAAKYFTGEHDFTSFRAIGSNVTTTVRTIYDARVFMTPPDLRTGRELVCFEVRGDGFLYNMVRIMVGTLAGVMHGTLAPIDICGVIDAKRRSAAGMTAPAQGLCLEKVEYSNDED